MNAAITITFTVWCRDCPACLAAPLDAGRMDAQRFWLGRGWTTGRREWRCPACGPAAVRPVLAPEAPDRD